MKRKSIDEQVSRFQELDNSEESIDQKLNELLYLLENSELDSTAVSKIQNKFNNAIDQNKISGKSLKLFKQIDEKGASRLEMAENLEGLLSNYKLDSKASKRFIMVEKVLRLLKLLAALVLIALGYAMIVMPATPAFEMYTIFYFSADDGVTLMDLISLLIVFTGVYLFVTSLAKINRQQ